MHTIDCGLLALVVIPACLGARWWFGARSKCRWYLFSPCVYFPLLLYQKEGEKEAPFSYFAFHFFLGAECRSPGVGVLSLRVDVARPSPRARVTCASSGF